MDAYNEFVERCMEDNRGDIPLEIQRALAIMRERNAYSIVLRAEQHLREANEYWENCCTDIRELEVPN